jgi:hypothetical protein
VLTYPLRNAWPIIVVDSGSAVDWWHWGATNQPRSTDPPR